MQMQLVQGLAREGFNNAHQKRRSWLLRTSSTSPWRILVLDAARRTALISPDDNCYGPTNVDVFDVAHVDNNYCSYLLRRLDLSFSYWFIIKHTGLSCYPVEERELTAGLLCQVVSKTKIMVFVIHNGFQQVRFPVAEKNSVRPLVIVRSATSFSWRKEKTVSQGYYKVRR